LIGKLRLGGTIFYASKVNNWRKLESIPVEEWLTRLSGRKVFERIWQPLLKAKLGDLYRETSASFIWSTIQRLYAARRSGMKKEMFGYLPGGYNRINLALRKKLEILGVEIRAGDQVECVRTEGDGLKVFTPSGESKFDKVVSTLASPLSLKLATLGEEERSLHAGIRYLGVICPSVLLNKAISPYYVTNIIDRESLFTGVIEMTALVSPEETGGRHLVYLPRYLESNDRFFAMSDNEIRDKFQDALLRMYPQLNPTDILAWNISRAKYVFALPTLHYSDRLPGVHTSIPGYFIVNSAQIINGTLNVNETIQVAERKLKEIMKP
jgi:protoporphyrinogen oxidase